MIHSFFGLSGSIELWFVAIPDQKTIKFLGRPKYINQCFTSNKGWRKDAERERSLWLICKQLENNLNLV